MTFRESAMTRAELTEKISLPQAREGLELEIHLRKDRRLFRGADRRRLPWPDEAHQAPGRQGPGVVRAEQGRDRDAQRSSDAGRRRADATHRSADLPLLRTRDGQRPRLEGVDRGA